MKLYGLILACSLASSVAAVLLAVDHETVPRAKLDERLAPRVTEAALYFVTTQEGNT